MDPCEHLKFYEQLNLSLRQTKKSLGHKGIDFSSEVTEEFWEYWRRPDESFKDKVKIRALKGE